MATYYHILGLDHDANAHQIKAAFKQLAMKYHPDRNPDDPTAEEKFKRINEAYHTLSDPLKKTRYDEKLGIGVTAYETENWTRRAKVYRPQYAPSSQPTYSRIDRNYYRIQGLAFLTFFILSGFCFAVIHTIYFFIEQNREKEFLANKQLLTEVHSLFNSGEYTSAFDQLQKLNENNSSFYPFRVAFDSLRNVLRKKGDDYYHRGDYRQSLTYYNTLKQYEIPPRVQTIERIAAAQFYLGDFNEALRSLKHMHNQTPNDLELIYQIGEINLLHVKNFEEAEQYFALGKKLLKKNLVEVYGEAYEVVMNPKDVPDLYYFIFESSAKTNLTLGRYDEVVKDCDWASYLRPEREEPDSLLRRAEALK